MSNVCPKGHFSSDPDYCSECGAPLQAVVSIASTPRSHGSAARNSPVTAPASVDSANCPDCMTPRPANARFCEVCRFDFVAGKSFSGLGSSDATPSLASPVVAQPAPNMQSTARAVADVAPPVVTPSAAAVVAGVGPAPRLLLRIVVDASLNKDPDPESPCPINAPERIFHLDLEENTLGRQFESNGVHPEIVVQDPGISRRHLKFIRDDNEHFSVLELGSANGTECNGKVLEPGVVTAVQPGDQLTLGMWTRVHVQAR